MINMSLGHAGSHASFIEETINNQGMLLVLR
jgi:hypothetical protein